MNLLKARLSRLPLRMRLVAGFSAAMLVVLLAAGGFVYWRVDTALDHALDSELTQALDTIAPLVGSDGQVSNRFAADSAGVAWQVLGASGQVLDQGTQAESEPLIETDHLARVGSTPRTFNIGDFLPVSDEPFRLLVRKSPTNPEQYVLVGVRRNHRDEALRELLAQLVLAGLGALAVTAFVGERLARAALRPVESYRRRAAAIAAGGPDLRLDVPPERDDEVTRLGHTLNDMLVALEHALDRERHFVNEASHELRTPITLLTSRVQLARRRPRSQSEHERVLEELQVDLDRLARLADQLLSLGRDGPPTAMERCDLVAVVARVVSQRRLSDPTHAGDMSVDLPTHAVTVAMADVEVERILTNILDNAVVHGAPPCMVTVDSPTPRWARLSVGDAGPGMPGEFLASATGRFSRTDEARSRPGAGLGLALVLAMVEGVAGELRLCHAGHHVSHGQPAPIDCSHGPGMTVCVLLPRAERPSD